MPTMKRCLMVIFALLLAACNFPVAAPMPVAAFPHTNILVSAPAGSTATPTPFQPAAPTPTFLPSATPTVNLPTAAGPVQATLPPPTFTATLPPPDYGVFPGPSEYTDFPIPEPVSRIPQPEGQVQIVLLGSDQRPNTGGFRTDTMLLVTLNNELRTANITSFPRDLYVYIPGWTMQRMNTAMAHGGFETLQMTFEYNFGVRPDYFVMINFWSFVETIDSLGGIDVSVGTTLTDQRSGHGDYTVYAGMNHMDGETALWYVRSRYSSSDFERTVRQQEVLKATFLKLLSLNAVKRAEDLYGIYERNVTTNLTFSKVTPLLPLAAKLADTSRITHYYISRQQVSGYVTSGGAQVLLPQREAVLAVMRQALNSP